MNLVALVFGILALLHIWTDSLVDIKPNFSSGKVILMASNTDLEANFFSLPSSKSPGPREGVLYVAEPLDACQKLSNKPEQSPNGISPFVLIARGGCNFKEKVENVVRAGFKAFIVHDDVHRDILVPGDLQLGAGRTIEHGSHRTAQSGAVRRVFSQDDRIVGCKIVFVIFSSL
ncbi:receptor homology region, transmembrane domain- and RING domain-containing protein 2-like isoform X2 [Raphanus sativus]|uniref:Receptor homology region, transmembrane domain- and RING domain-containing protein 2-like isoform X2 n=1 Tax=Raphanus sativus TaxID=3726 RepID=A0A9W3DQB0_RAPSA|nr:receptor homology region, transmembrane domain- and RING domain-containing protein 2-like isoform X2 [Raphanus sativus]